MKFRIFRTAVALVAVGMLAGCSNLGVKPWERDLLAKQDEEIARDLDKVNHQDVRMAYVHAVAGQAE